MPTNTKKFQRVLSVVGALMFVTVLARGQGAYYNDSYDGAYFYTDVVGYGGGCGLGGTYLWSSLSSYLSGTAYYPNQVSLPDSVYGSDGTTYSWSWGYTVDYTDPYTGYCGSVNISNDWNVKITHTYYAFTSMTSTGACEWYGNGCTSGTATCTGGYVVYPNPGTGCPPYVRESYAVVTTPFGAECLASPVAIGTQSGGMCN